MKIWRVIAYITVFVILLNFFRGACLYALSDDHVKPSIDDIIADSYIVADMNTGISILEHDADKRIHPASLTKILTAVAAMKSLNEDDIITTSQYAGSLSNNESKIDLIPGEQMKFKDMLFGMMVSSGNDAAVAIAEHVSGSIGSFASVMNSISAEIGAKNSSWVNPSGITDLGHTTTSRDLAVITRYAYGFDLFVEAVGTDYYSLPPTNKHPYTDWNVLENTNKLLRLQNDYYGIDMLYDIQGVKTGTTTAAGSNLIVTAHAKNGLELICVINGVRGDNARNIWVYAVALLENAARIQDGVHLVLSEGVETSINTSQGPQNVKPARSFSFFDPSDKGEFIFSSSISANSSEIDISFNDKIVFRTVYTAVESETSSEISSTLTSEAPEDKSSDKNSRYFLVAAIILVSLIVYTIIIWMIASNSKKKNRKKLKDYNNRNRLM